MPALTISSLAVKWGKARCWSFHRPAANIAAGHRLQADDDLNALGLSATAGSDPEFNALMTTTRCIFL